jgi:hypothetical protein
MAETDQADLEMAMKFVPAVQNLRHLFPAPGTTGHLPALGAFLFGRDGWCWVEGCFGGDGLYVHHAVLRKSDVQGWQPRERRCTIDNPYVCVSLCGDHHETDLEPSREEVADWMYEQYGEDFVRFLRWLKFKVHPLRGWLEAHG